MISYHSISYDMIYYTILYDTILYYIILYYNRGEQPLPPVPRSSAKHQRGVGERGRAPKGVGTLR